MLTDQQARLLPAIYNSAVSEAHWPAALDAVAKGADARGAVLFALDNFGAPFAIRQANSIYTPEVIAHYFANLVRHEQTGWDLLSRTPAGRIVTDLEAWGDVPNLQEREDYVFLKDHVGVLRRCVARLNNSPGWVDTLGLQFAPSVAVIPPESIRQAEALLPHVAKVVEIHRSFCLLKQRYNAVLAALDHVKIGVCVAGPHGDVIVANSEAQRIFSLADGLMLGVGSHLATSDPEAAGAIRVAIGNAVLTAQGEGDTSESAIAIHRRSGAYPFLVEVAPLKDSTGEIERELSGALLFIVDPENPRPFALDNMVRCFGLTEAESLVCALMVRGLTDSEIAAQRDVSVETVRSQTKSIYRKSGVSRRADLIRLTLSLTPPIEEPGAGPMA